MRRGAVALAGLLLTACSGAATPASSPLNTSRVAPSAAVPADPFPAADTAFDKLSQSMKRVWGDHGLTIIPGRDVEQTAPQAPLVVNMTGGQRGSGAATSRRATA